MEEMSKGKAFKAILSWVYVSKVLDSLNLTESLPKRYFEFS